MGIPWVRGRNRIGFFGVRPLPKIDIILEKEKILEMLKNRLFQKHLASLHETNFMFFSIIIREYAPLQYHSAGKRDRDLTPSPYNARWPEGPRAPLSERSEL